MTDAEKQAMLTQITGESNTDILDTYLKIAEGIINRKAYPFGDGTEELPAQYELTQVEIATYLLNKRGAEGETAHTENGVVRYYSDADVPPALLRRVVSVGKVI